ncbi:septum formation family protein [Asanoa siamensis]|uniref:Septum formation-related domain-containing protein n=1 Tax=Asanoa siamensis TaxID=926357 RepID=A0ABQ4CYV4_9ACTN|nr:septum formation family protein [Asanoa siamensis]GIF76460.1 hypothetical protein Asi02nite_59780 [Asanoa siamensis]
MTEPAWEETGYVPPKPSRRGWVVLLAVLGVLVALCAAGFVWFFDREGISRDLEAYEHMAVGTCFDVPKNPASLDVPMVPCDEDHDGEVIAQLRVYDARDWPGFDWFDAEFAPRCAEALKAYAPGADPAVESSWIATDEAGWHKGARWVSCVATDPAGKRSAPLRWAPNPVAGSGSRCPTGPVGPCPCRRSGSSAPA